MKPVKNMAPLFQKIKTRNNKYTQFFMKSQGKKTTITIKNVSINKIPKTALKGDAQTHVTSEEAANTLTKKITHVFNSQLVAALAGAVLTSVLAYYIKNNYLKNKVDELYDHLESKQRDIDQLRTTIEIQDRRIENSERHLQECKEENTMLKFFCLWKYKTPASIKEEPNQQTPPSKKVNKNST